MSTLRTSAAAAALAVAAILAAAVPAGAEPAKDAEAAAAPWVQLHASRARLVSGGATAAGGARLAGLEIVMDDGWKTYWRMPGDAGVPPTFDWSGSTNAASLKVLYPAPMRIPEAGGEAVGYKRSVLFPIEVTPQDPARPVALKLALEFGICRDICVPATANFELVLLSAGPAGANGDIAAAIDRVPRPQGQRRPKDPELKAVSVGEGDAGVRLTVAAAFGSGGGDAFVEAPDGLYVPMLRRQAPGADGVVRFTADLSADLASDLKGRTLTLTLVSDTGATEAQWTFP